MKKLVLLLLLSAVFIFLVFLVIRTLLKYLKSNNTRDGDASNKTLGEKIREYRISNNMSQEFVAESLEISRQAVSKWENGTSNPSTSNLIALAKLFNISPEDLI
ncbi:MAG: helix-turn-helix transcriptional regulator [Tissierellia bacterium]|nr:helix-turn-helix transcriptional regulator [Tissierellia bacterium]